MLKTYRFERFELRPDERVLLAGGQPVALGSRAFDLLVCLVERHDRVVSKAEVMEQVWPGQVVEENNLAVRVSALRKILGPGAIATVSGRGYRFTMSLEPEAARDPHIEPEAAPGRPSIAVLPLTVLSDDLRVAFFAQGLVEDLTALLARVPGFVLIAHASSAQYRDPQTPAQEVARQLGVRFLVQGSVHPRAGSLRVSMQLVEASSARILWSAQFDSQSPDAADAQESIARGIITELEPELTLAEVAHIRRQRPDKLDTWTCYHEGVAALASQGWSDEGFAAARSAMRRSTEREPNFGLGHGHYALLTILAASIGMLPDSPELRTEVLAAADAAIRCDAGSSEVLGYAGCALCDLGLLQRGTDTLQHALELNPSNAQAHVALGAAMALNDRLPEGIERLRYGMKISPRDRRIGFWGWVLGGFLLRSDRVDEALSATRAACRADPRFHLPQVLLAAILARQGDGDGAIAALRTARALRPKLTLQEVTKAHGRRLGAELGPIWAQTA